MMREKVPRLALVVDDEALIRWSVSEGLTDEGWLVRQAADGAQTLAALDDLAGRPFVAILDLRLPDVADLSLVHAVRHRRPDVPVVLMTAHGSAEQFQAAMDAGVYRVVDKPFDIGALSDLAAAAYTAAGWPEDVS